MQHILENKLNGINIKNDIVVFDVDRTLINTTSWYQACISPNLLIAQHNTKIFKELNDKTFNNPTDEKLLHFRTETLNLIEKKTSKNFLKKINTISNLNEYFILGEATNVWKFYVAGIYTAHNLVKIYNDAIKYINLLIKYYGSNLKIIFLTAGYEPFIRGVVEGIIQKNNILNLNYSVVGSTLKIDNEKITEEFHMSQHEKEKFLRQIINKGGKIKFLADDSKENMKLFELVRKNGGIALNIEHKKNQEENTTWKKHIKKYTKQYIKDFMMNDISTTASVNKKKIVLPKLLSKIASNTNELGISSLDINKFNKALSSLKSMIKNEDIRNNFEKNMKKIIFIKEDRVYLRGHLFYNWLPQYIFLDNRTVNQKWEDLISTSIKCLEIVRVENLLIKNINYNEKIIIYSLIDNLTEAILYLLNLIEQNNLKGYYIYEKEYKKVKDTTQNIMDLMYAFFAEKDNINNYLDKVLINIYSLKIINKIPKDIYTYKTMRELDNNITVFKTVKLIADELLAKNKKIDYVISFAYGGITLGFAFRSYLKTILGSEDVPKILCSHYSSKQKLREQRTEKDIDFSIFRYIPDSFRNDVEKIKKGNNNILLLDNNVTTFKTIELSKNFLTQLGNKVYCAVSAVNYENITNYILDEKCEVPVSNWRNVLDFHPIEEYITAFNTWKTSKKTLLLEETYFRNRFINDITINAKQNCSKNNFIFKLCRIQNIQDLNTAIKNNVNMIGIHAVYPDRLNYLKNEIKYKPITCNLNIDENLPLDILAIDAIRDMQRFIPNNMKQAILFERALPLSDMATSCDMYNLDRKKLYIQLQHRTNKEYIGNIKNYLSKKLIVTVGLFQKDFKDYFWKIHKCLNPITDYILIDMSKHQPDLISYSEEYKESINKASLLNHLVPFIEYNKVPIMIADDTTPEEMKEYVKIINNYKIKFAGIDMQNNVEYLPSEQKYQRIRCDGKEYQIKVRKSSDKLAIWKDFFDTRSIKI